MCIRYLINYHCGHVIPLDPAPTLCTRATSVIAEVHNSPCQPVEQQGIPSDDVCPGCVAVFAGLLERVGDRQRRRREGETVQQEDIVLDEDGMALFEWWLEQTRFRRMMAWFRDALASNA